MSIVQKGNKILRQKAKEVPVKEIKSKKIQAVIKRMAEILPAAKDGVALAAPQIGESLRIFIVKQPILDSKTPDAEKKPPLVFINPVIEKISQKKRLVSEGCLSTINVFGVIKRAEKVRVSAYDENGKKFTRGASGLLAQIIQHEMDHLEGVLFVDKAIRLEKHEN